MPMNQSEMEQAIRSLQESRTTNEAIFSETRRSEDRHYKLLFWTLGIVGGIFVLLLGYNAWNTTRVYTEITDRVNAARESLETQYNTVLTKQRDEFKNLKDELWKENKNKLDQFRMEVSKEQVEGFAFTLGQVADIRLFLHDVEGAVRAGLEQFDNATRSNTNYQAHAVDKLTEALTIGTKDPKRIKDELLASVQRLLERLDIGDPRTIKLKKTLESYRDTLRP